MPDDNGAQKPEQPTIADRLFDVGVKIWTAGKPAFDHGRDELAAALFGTSVKKVVASSRLIRRRLPTSNASFISTPMRT